MRLFKWIAANKIVIILPLLAFIAVSIFVFTQNRVQATNSNPAATESNPTPSVQTAVEPAAEKQVAAATATQAPAKAEITSTTAKVVFQVDNMSCSGCIATIKSSLAGYAGIQDIIVDIAGGLTEVYYDSRKIKDINPLASSITASGYPARVSRILTAEQISKEEAIAASRVKFYIASVSGWDISRSDFNMELAFAKNRYEQAYGQNVFASDQGKTLLDSLKVQVLLNSYLNEKVLGGAASDYDKQDQYRAWFNNARVLSKVTIYDSELKQLTRSQSSGSGCGQSSGSSCCSTDKS